MTPFSGFMGRLFMNGIVLLIYRTFRGKLGRTNVLLFYVVAVSSHVGAVARMPEFH